MSKIRAKIVHLSDLHFGRRGFSTQIDTKLIEPLKDTIKKEMGSEPCVNYLVVSGDLVEHPTPWSLKKAHNYIANLARDAGIPPERTLIIPGNHDYKISGLLGLRRFSRIPFEIYFRKPWSEGTQWNARLSWYKSNRRERYLRYLKLIANSLAPWGKELQDRIEKLIDIDNGIVMFGVVSTPVSFNGFATGKVSGAQITAIKDEIDQRKELKELFKIVVVHHHPIPVSYDGSNTSAMIEESLMVFYNAGGFMRETARQEVHLILHGHKHHSSFARITYNFKNEHRHTMGVLAAGSAAHINPGASGNEFNIISVFDDDTVKVDHWFYAEGIPHKDESEGDKYYLLNLQDIREQRKRQDELRTGMSVREESKTVEINSEGYSRIHIHLQDCRILQDTEKKAYKFEYLDAQRPYYIRGLQNASSLRFSELNETADSHLWHRQGEIKFGETLQMQSGLFDLAYNYQLINGHSLNIRELKRKSLGSENRENKVPLEFASITCERAAESLRLEVRFPENFDMQTIASYDALALYRPFAARAAGKEKQEIWEDHADETLRIQRNILLSKNGFVLYIPSPVTDFTYRIRWIYKEDNTAKATVTKENQLKSVRKELIKIARQVQKDRNEAFARYQKIIAGLQAFMMQAVATFPVSDATDRDETFQISLAIFDDLNNSLRFVAADFGIISSDDKTMDLIDETFASGEGCLGVAFEQGKVKFFFRHRDGEGHFIEPEEMNIDHKKNSIEKSSSLLKCETLICIPWVDESGIPMGVVNISSQFENSRLAHILDIEESEREKKTEPLVALTKRVLGAILISEVMGERQKEKNDG